MWRYSSRRLLWRERAKKKKVCVYGGEGELHTCRSGKPRVVSGVCLRAIIKGHGCESDKRFYSDLKEKEGIPAVCSPCGGVDSSREKSKALKLGRDFTTDDFTFQPFDFPKGLKKNESRKSESPLQFCE